MIRAIVADDHPVVRMGIVAILERARGIDVVGEACSSTGLMTLLETTGCDVLITDFSMPDDRFGDGLQMLDRLRRWHPGLAIVVLTMVSHPSTLRSMAALGCHGICDKRAPLTDCVRAIRAIASGGTFRSEVALSALAGWEEPEESIDRGPLSPREVEVVRLVAEGLTMEQIAVRLHRSPKTVSAQKRRAMLRLAVATDDALCLYAYASGLAWR
jgi:two-component system capsular synthesis response regulator RcsB